MTQSQISINENRLFSKIKRYFNGIDDALYETIQNAFRANMPAIMNGERPNLHIVVRDRIFEVQDFGVGIADIGKSLSIAESDWDEVTDRLSDPAGMGLFALIAASTEVTIMSLFGSISIDGNRFFDDKEYRDQLINSVDPDLFISTGTYVKAVLREAVSAERVKHVCRHMFDLNIQINGHSFEPAHKKQVLTDVPFKGGELSLNLHADHPLKMSHIYNSSPPFVIWQGKSMQIPDVGDVEVDVDGAIIKTSLRDVVPKASYIVIPSNIVNIVTPRLPTRDCLVADETTTRFVKELIAHMVMWQHNELEQFFDTKEKEGRTEELLLRNMTYAADLILRYGHKPLVDHHLRKRGYKVASQYEHWHGGGFSSRYDTVWFRDDDPLFWKDDVIIMLGLDSSGEVKKLFFVESCSDHMSSDLVLDDQYSSLNRCVDLVSECERSDEWIVARPSVKGKRKVIIVEVPESYISVAPDYTKEELASTVKVCPELKIKAAELNTKIPLREKFLEGDKAVESWEKLKSRMGDIETLPDKSIAFAQTFDYNFENCVALGVTEKDLCSVLSDAAELAKDCGAEADDDADAIQEEIENSLNSTLTEVTGTIYTGSVMSDLVNLLGENPWERTIEHIALNMREKSIKWTLSDGTQKQQSFVEG